MGQTITALGTLSLFSQRSSIQMYVFVSIQITYIFFEIKIFLISHFCLFEITDVVTRHSKKDPNAKGCNECRVDHPAVFVSTGDTENDFVRMCVACFIEVGKNAALH